MIENTNVQEYDSNEIWCISHLIDAYQVDVFASRARSDEQYFYDSIQFESKSLPALCSARRINHMVISSQMKVVVIHLNFGKLGSLLAIEVLVGFCVDSF